MTSNTEENSAPLQKKKTMKEIMLYYLENNGASYAGADFAHVGTVAPETTVVEPEQQIHEEEKVSDGETGKEDDAPEVPISNKNETAGFGEEEKPEE